MKVWLLAGLAVGLCAAPAPVTWDLIDLAAISRMTPRQLEMLAEGLAAEEMIRSKRSSSVHALGQIASKVTSGLASKVSLVGQASAGASSFIAGASSKGGDHGYSYEPHEEKKVDFWGLKKSILNTLFQAVKAITGGVTIIKGQLIKGGGALAAVAGKLISVKGDAVSNLGKKIVNSAQLVPHKKQHASAPVAVYGPPPSLEYLPSAYGVPPSAPAHYSHTAHSAPSAPTGPGFTTPNKYTSHFEGYGKPLSGLHAGVILLRPLDSDPSPHPHHREPRPAPASDSHTALEPPSTFIYSAFKALKGVFANEESKPEPEPEPEQESAVQYEHDAIHYPPPPPPPPPPSGSGSWGMPVNSYGEPTHNYFNPYVDTAYDPRDASRRKIYKHAKSLTPEKLHKVTENLKKIPNLQRSSAELPLFDGIDLYRDMLEKFRAQSKPVEARSIPSSPDPGSFLNLNAMSPEATPIPSSALDALKAILHTSTTERPNPTTKATTITTTTKTKSVTKKPDTTTVSSNKSPKYVLRGNRIVEV